MNFFTSFPSAGLVDRFQRQISYLRVSVTDRCNLGCIYCMPSSGKRTRLRHLDILRYEELLRILRIGVGLGIRKVRITGGEPLVRKGIDGFLARAARIPGIEDFSLTTNGLVLLRHLNAIREAGIRRLNISLDTLDPECYRRITGQDGFSAVWEGILAARQAGFAPIKINAVAMAGVNENDLTDLAALTFQYPFHVRFIEYMPVGYAAVDRSRRLLASDIMERIQGLGHLIPCSPSPETSLPSGPAEYYRFAGAPGKIGFIRPWSGHFCASCTRLRLTAAGIIRPCLLSERGVDIRAPLREGRLDKDLAAIFLQAAARKPAGHHLGEREAETVKTGMSGIGG